MTILAEKHWRQNVLIVSPPWLPLLYPVGWEWCCCWSTVEMFVPCPLQLVKLCSGMLEAGKAYVSANKLFVSGIRDLSQQCKKDEMISVSLSRQVWYPFAAIRTFACGTVAVFPGLSSWVRVNLITNRLVSQSPTGSGNGFLPERNGILLLTPRRMKTLLGFKRMTNCVFSIKIMFILVVSIVQKKKDWIRLELIFPPIVDSRRKENPTEYKVNFGLFAFPLLLSHVSESLTAFIFLFEICPFFFLQECLEKCGESLQEIINYHMVNPTAPLQFFANL